MNPPFQCTPPSVVKGQRHVQRRRRLVSILWLICRNLSVSRYLLSTPTTLSGNTVSRFDSHHLPYIARRTPFRHILRTPQKYLKQDVQCSGEFNAATRWDGFVSPPPPTTRELWSSRSVIAGYVKVQSRAIVDGRKYFVIANYFTDGSVHYIDLNPAPSAGAPSHSSFHSTSHTGPQSTKSDYTHSLQPGWTLFGLLISDDDSVFASTSVF